MSTLAFLPQRGLTAVLMLAVLLALGGCADWASGVPPDGCGPDAACYFGNNGIGGTGNSGGQGHSGGGHR